LLVNGSGQLTGATGVDVGGLLYDVSFAQCSAMGGGFSDACTPFFHTEVDATAAAQALLDQVFIDGAGGLFDSNPGATLYCSGSTFCMMAVPYTGAPFVDSQAAFNLTTDAGDNVSYAPWYYTGSEFTVPLNVAIFTRAVPEPASWALMLLGFAAIGASVRGRRPAPLPAAS
jgi:hypothetical protein